MNIALGEDDLKPLRNRPRNDYNHTTDSYDNDKNLIRTTIDGFEIPKFKFK